MPRVLKRLTIIGCLSGVREMKKKIGYHEFMYSNKWRQFQKHCLTASHHRCAFTHVRLTHYNIHHTHYHTFGGAERYWFDCIPLHPWVHDHIVHGVLSGWKRPRQQRHYPNLPQRVFHSLCRLNLLMRIVFVDHWPLLLAAIALGWLMRPAWLQFLATLR